MPKGTAHCFNCGYPKGWGFHRTEETLKQLLGENLDFSATETPEPAPEAPVITLPEDFELLEASTDYWMAKAWQYVAERGMGPAEIIRQGLGLSLLGKAAYRVVFPVVEDDKLAGWTARTLAGAQPKWLHAFGLRSPYWGRRTKGSGLIVTEGVFDALAVTRVVTELDVLALLGTNLSQYKKEQISNYDSVCLWLDPDEPGRKATISLAEMLTEQGKQVTVVSLKQTDSQAKLDPGELTPEEINNAWAGRKAWSRRLGLALAYSIK